MRIRKINGVVKNYDWGNKDFIPSLIGGYDDKPQAELWFGTHPAGEATLSDGSLLSTLIKSDRSILGSEYDEYGGELPLLLKILAIAKPLSLQCHPDRAQAEDGWKREEEARKSGVEYDYKDPNPKAEIIAALSPITALCGFRNTSDAIKDLASIIPASYERIIKRFGDEVKDIYLGFYSLTEEEKTSILSELKKSLEESSDEAWKGLFLTRKGIALECLEEHPGDIGAVFPYLMNVIHLQINEALFLRPGTLHAYVFGNGVELMNASDNVLRGGLTTKRMNLKELERIMDFSPIDVSKVRTGKDGYGRTLYETPAPEFSLLAVSEGSYEVSGEPLSLVLSTEGAVRFSEEGESLVIEKGECALVPSSSLYTMKVRGRAFIARVGRK